MAISICYIDGLIFWEMNKKDIVDLTIQLHVESIGS